MRPRSDRDEIDALTVRIPQAMRMLGIGRTKLYELISEREIETLKIGRATLVVVQSLHAFVARECAKRADRPHLPRRGRPRISYAALARNGRS